MTLRELMIHSIDNNIILQTSMWTENTKDFTHKEFYRGRYYSHIENEPIIEKIKDVNIIYFEVKRIREYNYKKSTYRIYIIVTYNYETIKKLID